MPIVRVATLTTLAIIVFADNLLLCRVALKDTGIYAASSTSIRLVSDAAVLWAITILFRRDRKGTGNLFSKQWVAESTVWRKSDFVTAM